MKPYGVTIQMKPLQQYFHMVAYKMKFGMPLGEWKGYVTYLMVTENGHGSIRSVVR